MQSSTELDPFDFEAETNFTDPDAPVEQQDAEGRSIKWSLSTFTCGPDVVDGPEAAESTQESFLDIVQGEWPYIALAGGADPLL